MLERKQLKLSPAKVEKRAAEFIALIKAETKKSAPKNWNINRDFMAETWESLIDDYVLYSDAQIAKYILDNPAMMRVVRAYDKSRQCSDMRSNEREGFGAGLRACIEEADEEREYKAAQAAKKAKAAAKKAKPVAVAKKVSKPKWQKHLDAKEIALFEKTAKAVSPKFTGYDYWNWLGEDGIESEDAYNRFDRAVKRLMGKQFYEAAESTARCDNLLHAIIAGKITHKDGITENIFREWKKAQKK